MPCTLEPSCKPEYDPGWHLGWIRAAVGSWVELMPFLMPLEGWKSRSLEAEEEAQYTEKSIAKQG